MTSRTHTCPPPFAALLALVLTGALGALPVPAADEHAEHAQHADHAQHDMSRDDLGRRMYGMKHEMDAATLKELREHVELYRSYTDAQVGLSMENMGGDYEWYISPPGLKADQGVLVLTHGFREKGDKVFRDKVQEVGNIFPTALGMGMSMTMSQHIQLALDDLKAAGAKEIVVVPVLATRYADLYRQWGYIFGREKLPEYTAVPKVHTDAKIHFEVPPEDHPLVAEILIDYATEISTDPAHEIVIIAGHGPNIPEDNANELKVLASLAKQVKEDTKFAAVSGITLQDDAPPPVREANVKKLRAMIEAAAKDGRKTLIVTNLISVRSIQAKLRTDLDGLDYKFNPKGLIEHENFMKWMRDTVRYALERK
jgi:sirohydrochlorin cobaltochelatase